MENLWMGLAIQPFILRDILSTIISHNYSSMSYPCVRCVIGGSTDTQKTPPLPLDIEQISWSACT